MKILVLNGSPRREHSDTMHITRAFLDGMREAAHQDIHVIHVIDRHIEFCTGCFSCMRNGGTCVHDDDMRAILDEILSSDLLIWSFPLYCYGMPAPLKALLDRTLPLSGMAMQKVRGRYEHVAQADFSHLRYLMICGCALVKQAGKQYAEAGGIDAALLAEIGAPMIPEEQYAAIVNGGG